LRTALDPSAIAMPDNNTQNKPDNMRFIHVPPCV
jgi:hypothetical protein